MNDETKTREQLINELNKLRQENAALKASAEEALVNARSALTRSEERYRTIGELIPFGVWVYDLEKGIVYLSESFLDMIGMSLEEYKALGWEETLGLGEANRLRVNWEECLGSLCFWDHEFSIRDKEGRFRTILSRGVPMRERDGRVSSWVGINLDITNRKSMEEKLRESRRTLSTLISNLPGTVYRCLNDSNWTMEFLSEGCQDMTGYSASDLIGNRVVSYGDLIHPDDRETVWKGVQESLRKGEPFRLVYRIISASGEERRVWEQGRGIFSPSGELEALEGFITDITEHTRAQEILRESEEKYRALVESSSDAILMADAQRKIISYNQAFIDLFGFMAGEIKGKSARVIHPSEESFRKFLEQAYPAIESRGSWRAEWQLMRRNGTVFPVEESLSAVRGRHGSIIGYVAIIRDITRRKQVEEELATYQHHLEDLVRERTRELEEAQKALIHKEKLKTLGALSAEVAHEIRNPLTVIGGFVKRLQKRHPDMPETEIILRESLRLERILERFSSYLRPVEMRLDECSVNAIIAESVNLLSHELERQGITLHLDLAPELPPAYVDPGILAQAVLNVIQNTVGAQKKGTTLFFRTYDVDQHICLESRTRFPSCERIENSGKDHIPFEDRGRNITDSLCSRVLTTMGGNIAFVQQGNEAVATICLLKAFQPSSDIGMASER